MEWLNINPRTNRLDFGGNRDLDPDPGIFRRNFTITVLAIIAKTPHLLRFGNNPNTRRLADLKLNKLKAALAQVCALRVLLVSFCNASYANVLILILTVLIRCSSENILNN